MIRTYNEIYLDSVKRNLAELFDIGINGCGEDADELGMKFVNSNVSSGIENGHPNYLAGKSGRELLIEVLNKDVSCDSVSFDRTPEYWAGWILAYTEWYLNKSFKKILELVSFSKIINMYHPYHEAPEEKCALEIKELMQMDSNLKIIRKKMQLSQSQLAKMSGVKLRNIECYEQGDIPIENARGETLYALSKALNCTIEDLLK